MNTSLLTDAGLKAAIAAMGTRYRLAKELGLSQPAVAKWTRIPIKRVLEVEKVTGVDRQILRPELYQR